MLTRAAREVLGGAAAAVDHAVNLAALSRSGGQRRTEDFRHEERIALLGRLAERYAQAGAQASFFRPPRVIEPTVEERAPDAEDRSVLDLTWPSDFKTFLPEVHTVYSAQIENHTAHARLVTSRDGVRRPVAILIHGYLGGVHRVERRIWPIDFLRRIGMDVALFVLPFHGSRFVRRFGQSPPFPGADPRITNEGFRQAMGDFTDLVSWLLDRGHPSVGVMGMSLGAFTTALAATLEARLSFAIPIIPLASFPDVFRHQGRLGVSSREIEAQHRALERVYAVTSPLDRPAVIPPERILVVAGERDRITPITHARKLARHFGCRMETWPGGHLVQVGRSEKFRSVGRFLGEIGIVSRDGAG